MLLEHFVSSENKINVENLTTEGIYVIYTYTGKSSGPKILPCGIPDETGNKSESWFQSAKHCCLVEG